MPRIRLYARRGEEGAALPMALAFLILCAVMTTIIIDYTGVGDRTAGRLGAERNAMYSVTSALDSAVKYVQTQPTTVGSNSDPNCPPGSAAAFYSATENGAPVTVNCSSLQTANNGASTLYPNFAILTTAAYHNGPAPVATSGTAPGCVNEFPNELGIVQVQNSKLLQVEGNVYVNSDVDADIWQNGCPLQTTAQHIKVVNGQVLQRESLHDIDACPNLHDHVTDCNGANNNNYLPSPLSSADQAALTDPQLSADPTVAAQWQPNFNDPPAPGVITDGNDNVITSCPAADPTTGYRLIKFKGGTYSDVSVLNGFTNGGCPNAVLWFAPGDYYFNFTNSGTPSSTLHQWTINDTGIRIIGGEAFAGPDQSPTLFSETWKPTTATSTSSGSGSSPFNNLPAAATGIDGSFSNATIANGGSATLNLSGIKNTAGTSIPPDAQIDSVRLRVAHGEANTALLKAPTVTITPAGGSPCTAVPVTPRAGAPVEDPAPNYNVFTISGTECLNDVSRINSTVKIAYTVSHCSPTTPTGPCTTATTTDSVDGIWLDITYTTGGRLSWNPQVPSTITPSAPTVPGGCLSDKDQSLGWNNGVEFVMGGDSHIELKTGKLELCDQQSAQHQEMVIYGVPNRSPVPVGPTTWTSFVTGTNNGFTNPDSGRLIGGTAATATLNSSGARTLQLTEFSPTAPASWPIAAANQIPAGSTINTVTLNVAHGEGVSGSNTGNVNTPTVTITGANGTNCGSKNLTIRNSIGTDQVTGLASCLNTPAALNGGVNATYSVSRAKTTTVNESLDGMSLSVTYTPPPSAANGTLTPESGCVTQAPYYSPVDHSPAYNGACALIQVAPTSVPANPAIDGSFPRVLALWGTAYAPSAAFDVPVDVMTTPVFDRGVVARTLMLGYNVANNAIVPITTTPAASVINSNRDMVLTATIGTTSVRAEVKVCDVIDPDPSAPGACSAIAGDTIGGPDPTVKVLSWKVTR